MQTEDIARELREVNPATRLSSLILAYTGVFIAPDHIKKVIRSDFVKLSALAHQIHDEAQA